MAIPITVDTAVELFVNKHPLTDDTDFKTRETFVAYDATGMDLVWNFVTAAGVLTQTAVTPTTGGDYDWTHVGNAMYKIEMPASGGASINNSAEGVGWFTGVATGVLPWTGPEYEFKPANVIGGVHTGGDRLQVDVFEIEGVDATDALDNKAKFETNIATYTSNTSFVLTAKPPNDDTLNGWTYIVTDQLTAAQKGTGYVTDYDGTGTAGTVTTVDTNIFTYAVGDFVTFFPPGTVHPSQLRSALGMASANLDTQLAAIVDDTNELQSNQGNWTTATGFSTHSAADVRTEMDNNSTKLSDIVGDTNQLQTDLVDGGRLDLLIDAILSDTNNLNDQAIAEIASVTDIPATPTLRQAIMLVYQWLRNNTEATTAERKIRNDAGSVVLEGDMTDSAGAFTQGKLGNPD